jgi:hypothetical protein
MTIKQFCRKYYDYITGGALYAVALAAIIDTYVFAQSSPWYYIVLGFAIVSVIASVTCYLINDQGR